MQERRILLLQLLIDENLVDLGLPSGLLWAKGNLKKKDGKFVIADETEYGDFWSWGNVGDTSPSVDGYKSETGGAMTNDLYKSTPGYNLKTNIPVNVTYDVVRNKLGAPWRLPTYGELSELRDNTDKEWATINGVGGWKFMKKTDHSVYIFLPASGYCRETLYQRNLYGTYWSSTYHSSSYAYETNFYDPSIRDGVSVGTGNRYEGHSIRPVYNPHKNITITLTGNSISNITLILTDSEDTLYTATTNSTGVASFNGVAYGSARLCSTTASMGFTPYTITINASTSSFTVETFTGTFVNLGLPSGTLWASSNLQKTSSTTAALCPNETDYGDYWSWANVGLTNTTGWAPSSGSAMTEEKYNSTTGASQSGWISSNDASHDVAYKYLGAPWRLPTGNEIQELIDYTTSVVTTINGISGRKFMKKTDRNIYVFLPASGVCYESGLYKRGSYGIYWSSTLYYTKTEAITLYFSGSSSLYNGAYNRYWGFSIRPVRSS